MTNSSDIAAIPQAANDMGESRTMSAETNIHNPGPYARVIDAHGHILGGGESRLVALDSVTERQIRHGALIIIETPTPPALEAITAETPEAASAKAPTRKPKASAEKNGE